MRRVTQISIQLRFLGHDLPLPTKGAHLRPRRRCPETTAFGNGPPCCREQEHRYTCVYFVSFSMFLLIQTVQPRNTSIIRRRPLRPLRSTHPYRSGSSCCKPTTATTDGMRSTMATYHAVSGPRTSTPRRFRRISFSIQRCDLSASGGTTTQLQSRPGRSELEISPSPSRQSTHRCRGCRTHRRGAVLILLTRGRMYITIVELSEDERSAARELRENSCLSSACRDPNNADCSATYDDGNDDGSDDGANRDAASRFDFSDGDNKPAAVPSVSAGSEPQDVTNSEYDDAEEYYSAEEDGETDFGESLTWCHSIGTSCRCARPPPHEKFSLSAYIP